MSTTLFSNRFEKLGVLLLTFFMSVFAMAQETTEPAVNITTTTKTTTEQWYSNPIYWVIGALLFIIIIAIVARGGGKRD